MLFSCYLCARYIQSYNVRTEYTNNPRQEEVDNTKYWNLVDPPEDFVTLPINNIVETHVEFIYK